MPQSEVDYIIYTLTHWQVGIKIHQLDPGGERDRLVRLCQQHCNGTKLAETISLKQIQGLGENPCIALRRQEKDADVKLFPGGLLYQGSKSSMLSLSAIEAMCTWVRKGPAHIAHKFIRAPLGVRAYP